MNETYSSTIPITDEVESTKFKNIDDDVVLHQLFSIVCCLACFTKVIKQITFFQSYSKSHTIEIEIGHAISSRKENLQKPFMI